MTIGNSSLHQIARSNDRSLKTNLAQVLTDAPICQEARDDSVKSKYQRIVSGKIVHAHIVPTFSRKVDKDTGLDVKNNGSAKSLHSDRECLHSKEIDTESAKDEYITGKISEIRYKPKKK